ncbi:MAG: uroporphyrinogen decarboxylase family protein [Lentisphaeria bacterium]|jgi:uroporphyrinogen decarboxylase
MIPFQPDYRHIVDAALNRTPKRLPLYEHNVTLPIVAALTGKDAEGLFNGNRADKAEFFRIFCRLLVEHGYDVVPFEVCACEVVQKGKGLVGQAGPLVQTLADVEAFPWKAKLAEYQAAARDAFAALRSVLPPGMKVVGGVGNGLMETIQDFVPYQQLAYLMVDEPAVYARLWTQIGDMLVGFWEWVLAEFADIFAVCRFGDDLGFRTSTLISPDDIRAHIIPQYRRITDLVHRHGKPFLLHSCGQIHEVMDDLIRDAKIDAKHSNEDQICPFRTWLERYGDRIGNFGGIEMNVLCLKSPAEIGEYVREVLAYSQGHGGVAIGSGNQISSYIPPQNFIALTEAVRRWRGDF